MSIETDLESWKFTAIETQRWFEIARFALAEIDRCATDRSGWERLVAHRALAAIAEKCGTPVWIGPPMELRFCDQAKGHKDHDRGGCRRDLITGLNGEDGK